MKDLKPELKKLDSAHRLYQLDIPIMGLTGGIATGKSTVSRTLIKQGIPLIDADQLVKDIYNEEKVREHVRKNYPEAWQEENIHFPTLREKFFKDHKVKDEIERLIYSRLPDAFMRAYHKMSNPPFIVYDVPLLFEKNLQDKMDMTVLVYAPRTLQKSRIMARDGHTDEMAENILSHQLGIEDKKMRADFVIDNSKGLSELAVEVDNFLRQVLV